MTAVDVLKLAYRKHVIGDASIGWEELGSRLSDALANELGDEEFEKWRREQGFEYDDD